MILKLYRTCTSVSSDSTLHKRSALRCIALLVTHRSILRSIMAMNGGRPVDLTTPERPVMVPESPDSTLAQPPGEMANLPQIQVMSPRSNQDYHKQELGYDAISAQHNLVQRALNQPYHAISAENVPVPDEVTLREVHVREAVFSNTRVSAQGHVREAVYRNTLVSAQAECKQHTSVCSSTQSAIANGPTLPSTQFQEDVDQVNRNVRRRTSNPPSTGRSSSCPETPTSSPSPGYVQQDASIQNLRGQLQHVQQQATTEIEAQRASVVAAAEQHVHDSRVQDAADVAQTAAALKQEYENELAMLRNNAQNERIRFQQETDAQARAMIEAQVNERMNILHSEMRNAALRSAVDSQQVVQTTFGILNVPKAAPVSIVPGISGLSNSNDSGSNTLVSAPPTSVIYHSNTQVSAGVTTNNTLVSATLEEACYVCADPMSVTLRNLVTQQEFHSPVEDRTSLLQSMPLEPSGISIHATREFVFEDSPCTGFEPQFPVAECTGWLRGSCEVGEKCQFLHSRKTGNAAKREVSWDRRLVRSSSDSNIVMYAHEEGEHTDIPAAPVSSASSHLQEEMDKLRSALSKSNAELHYAQMQLQLKARKAAPPSDSTQHYDLADEDDDNPYDSGLDEYDYGDDDYEYALESHESVQKPNAEINIPVGDLIAYKFQLLRARLATH